MAFTPHGVRVLDCIEFNDRFRVCAVAADLAFLLMDLDYRGRRDLADEVLARYLAIAHDGALPLLLPFYRCNRAYVRGKVNAFQSNALEIAEPQQAEAAQSAKRHFRLALEYCRIPQRPQLIVMVGATGTGKSYLAAALAGRLGARVISSDLIRKQLVHLAPEARSGSRVVGAGIYDADTTERTYAELVQKARAGLRRDEPVILDATFTDARDRAGARRLTAEFGLPCDFILCEASEQTVRKRIRARGTDPTAASEGTWAVYQRQKELLGALEDVSPTALHRIDTSEHLADAVPAALARVPEGVLVG